MEKLHFNEIAFKFSEQKQYFPIATITYYIDQWFGNQETSLFIDLSVRLLKKIANFPLCGNRDTWGNDDQIIQLRVNCPIIIVFAIIITWYQYLRMSTGVLFT